VRNNELEPYGEVTDPRERANLLDQGLDALARYWAGEFEPLPVQRPRPPVWVAGEWPNRRPVRRALRWDGLFAIGLPGPGAVSGGPTADDGTHRTPRRMRRRVECPPMER